MDRLSSTTYMGIGIVHMVIIDMFKVVFSFSLHEFQGVSMYKSQTRRQGDKGDLSGQFQDKETRGTFSEVIPMRLDQLPPPILLSPHPAISIAPHPTVPVIDRPFGTPPGLCPPGSNESLFFDQVCHIIWECETAVHVEMWGLASRLAWRPAQVEKLRPATVAFSGK